MSIKRPVQSQLSKSECLKQPGCIIEAMECMVSITLMQAYILQAWTLLKGQIISKANYQAVNSSKRTNKWIHYTSIWRVSVCFLKEIEDSKKAFPNYLTFIKFDFLSLGDRRQKTSLRSIKRCQSWSIKAPIWPSP